MDTKNKRKTTARVIIYLLGMVLRVFGNPLLGIGLGTVLSMIGVGRVIYFFNHLAKARLQKLAGLA